MRLYHGTNEANLSKIKLHGLRPRQRRKSQWKEYPSRPDMVYLTTAYALYFALNSKGKSRYMILEIESDELDQNKFFPDEDFIAQKLAWQEKAKLSDIHLDIRDNLEAYQQYWQDSIDGLGNCCYKGTIPFSAIKRICFLEPNTRMYIEIMAVDPAISILNYTLLGSKYRGLLAWLFGEQELLPGSFSDSFYSIPIEENPMKEIMEKEMEHRKKESSDRSGIEIWQNGKLSTTKV